MFVCVEEEEGCFGDEARMEERWKGGGVVRAASGQFPHGACEVRRTFGAGEQNGHGTLRDQIEGGTAASGRAARFRMGGHTSSANSPETLLQSVYWSSKKTFQKNWVKRQCSMNSQTQPILASSSKPLKRGVPKRSSGKLQRVATCANSNRCSTI